MVEILAVAGRVINGLLHGSAIVRMDAPDNEFQGRSGRPIVLEDPECLLRPEELSTLDLPAKASGTA